MVLYTRLRSLSLSSFNAASSISTMWYCGALFSPNFFFKNSTISALFWNTSPPGERNIIKIFEIYISKGYIHTKGSREEGGLAKAYTPYKKYHFSYTKCILGGGGKKSSIFVYIYMYYVNDRNLKRKMT